MIKLELESMLVQPLLPRDDVLQRCLLLSLITLRMFIVCYKRGYYVNFGMTSWVSLTDLKQLDWGDRLTCSLNDCLVWLGMDGHLRGSFFALYVGVFCCMRFSKEVVGTFKKKTELTRTTFTNLRHRKKKQLLSSEVQQKIRMFFSLVPHWSDRS